ncbi:hypothetical protein M514_22140 [Trichuris suis]|uniref:Uncharacterized protein n=1 Tax=Trichuris suis TaxID=68888 RepID=A0A085N867_9BILA|nr:hypothetical protein M514_22140 [Trichuris suis]
MPFKGNPVGLEAGQAGSPSSDSQNRISETTCIETKCSENCCQTLLAPGMFALNGFSGCFLPCVYGQAGHAEDFWPVGSMPCLLLSHYFTSTPGKPSAFLRRSVAVDQTSFPTDRLQPLPVTFMEQCSDLLTILGETGEALRNKCHRCCCCDKRRVIRGKLVTAGMKLKRMPRKSNIEEVKVAGGKRKAEKAYSKLAELVQHNFEFMFLFSVRAFSSSMQ